MADVLSSARARRRRSSRRRARSAVAPMVFAHRIPHAEAPEQFGCFAGPVLDVDADRHLVIGRLPQRLCGATDPACGGRRRCPADTAVDPGIEHVWHREEARVGERPDAQPVPGHLLDSFDRHVRDHRRTSLLRTASPACQRRRPARASSSSARAMVSIDAGSPSTTAAASSSGTRPGRPAARPARPSRPAHRTWKHQGDAVRLGSEAVEQLRHSRRQCPFAVGAQVVRRAGCRPHVSYCRRRIVARRRPPDVSQRAAASVGQAGQSLVLSRPRSTGDASAARCRSGTDHRPGAGAACASRPRHHGRTGDDRAADLVNGIVADAVDLGAIGHERSGRRRPISLPHR